MELSEQDMELVMEVACDLCHYPMVSGDQEDLDVFCERCPLATVLKGYVIQ